MSWRRFKNSLVHALRGIRELLSSQQNFRLEILLAIIASLIIYFLRIPAVERAVLFTLMLFILSAEVINSIFETTLDSISKSFSPHFRKAKDMMAGFTLLLIVGSLIVATVILYPRFISLFQ